MHINLELKNIIFNPINLGTLERKKFDTEKISFFDDNNFTICKNGNLELSYDYSNGHIFFSKYVKKEFLHEYYSKNWLKINNKKDKLLTKVKNKYYHYKAMKFYNKVDNFKVDIFKNLLDKNSKVLDIGCGNGHFLNSLSPYVKELYGFEISKYEKLYKKQNINYIFNNIEKLLDLIKSKSIDLIILHHVVEHYSKHDKLFEIIHKLLSDHGKVIIVVPNNDFSDLLSMSLFLPHAHNFTLKSLENLINKYELNVMKIIKDKYSLRECFFICEKKKIEQQVNNFKNDDQYKELIKKTNNLFNIQNSENNLKNFITTIEPSNNLIKTLVSSYPFFIGNKHKYLSREFIYKLSYKDDNKLKIVFKNQNENSLFMIK